MEADSANNETALPGYLNLWKKKDKLSTFMIKPAKKQMSDLFDELLELESSKNKKQ